MKAAAEFSFTVSDQKDFPDLLKEVKDKIEELVSTGESFTYTLPDGKPGKITDQSTYDQAKKAKANLVKLIIPPEEQKDSAFCEFELLDNVDAIEDSPENTDKREEDKEDDPLPEVKGAENTLRLDSCFLCGEGKVKQDCEICKGTGKLRKELQDHVEKLVKQGITEFNEIRKRRLKLEDNQVLKSQVILNFANAGKTKTIHTGTKCSACGVTPITGVRYCCTVCHNTNFCEGCETIITHTHPVIKYRNLEAKVPEGNPVYKKPENDPKLCAKYVSCTLKENQSVLPGETFAVKWNLTNTGECNWPKDTIIALDEESMAKVKMQTKPIGEVAPTKSILSITKITAPKNQGKCVIFLQLQDAKTGKRFGQKFWADFNVQTKDQLKESEYTENMLKLAQMYESTDPEVIIKLLKENKNNAELVANLLISQVP